MVISQNEMSEDVLVDFTPMDETRSWVWSGPAHATVIAQPVVGMAHGGLVWTFNAACEELWPPEELPADTGAVRVP